MFFKKKGKAPLLFNPRLGKATVDVGLMDELTFLQLNKWKEHHNALLSDLKIRASLTVRFFGAI